MRCCVATGLLGVAVLTCPPGTFAQPADELGDRTSVTRGAIGVERFRNLSRDPSDAWVGDGIAEALAVDLGARATTPRWVVRGAYQRLGNRIQITAAVIDTDTRRTVHTARVDGELTALFQLQDELGAQLAAGLGSLAAAPGGEARFNAEAASAEGGAVPETAIAESATGRPSTTGAPAPDAAPPVASVSRSARPRTALAMSAVVIDGPPPPIAPEVAARDGAGRVTVRAIRLDEPLTLDGQLDERVYHTVEPITDFIQQEPDEGAPATEQTEVWIMFDHDTIYIAARCWNSEPDRIIANEMKRDAFGMFGNETFAVVLDTFYDRRNGVAFITNALGGLFDTTITDEGRTYNMDWNAVWDVQSSRFEDGWNVEMAIPFKSLRYRSDSAQIWGINFERRVPWKNEASFLTPIPAALSFNGMFQLSSAATLVDLEVPDSGTRIEIKPYAISDLTTDVNANPPLANVLGGDVGFDVKYGVTEALTADFTYNTDFAQVEVDEQQVDLTRFSLFFPEKREFFLEGQGIFDFGAGYRTDPTVYYFSGELFPVQAPILFFSRRIGFNDGRAVPILGGGRLTGKVGPYSVGVLDVQTDEDVGSGAVPTNFSVVRLKRDVLRRSSVGGMFTGRSVSTAGQGANYTYGVDANFSFYDNLNINAYLAGTDTPRRRGDDTSHQAKLDYNGDRWGVLFDHLDVGANFNPEIGFVRRDDLRRNFAKVRYSPRPHSIDAVRKFLWEGSVDYITDGRGRLETRLQQALFGIEFENSDRFFAGVTDNYELLQQSFPIARDVTIPVGAYSFVNTRLVYALGQQRKVSGGVTFDHGGFFGGDKTSVGYMFGRVGLTPQLYLEPTVSVNWVTLPEGDFTSELVSTRATYTVSPRMFVAALLQFNSGADSLSTNIRLRWEYRPGSELFVVYTDERNTLTPRFPTLQNRAFVVKINRLFRF